VYRGEPETKEVWPGYRPATPGARPAILFDPRTGKLAYPLLRPHLGKRPPFAPNHGPAPFLEPIHQGTRLPRPGENGPWSLCPAGTRQKRFDVRSVVTSLDLNAKRELVDPTAQLFVLNGDKARVQKDNAARVPLAIRANAGEDCVDLTFASELEDDRENGFFSKANLHVHLVQFDVQGSDGVSAGYNYEQSVRPYAVEGERLTNAAAKGDRRLPLTSAARFQAGALVGVGMERRKGFEVRRIVRVEGKSLVLDEPLSESHPKGAVVSAEFVRYRWYPDAQFGTAYFHDHVNGLVSWRHGLFGALVAEPPGSTYHDPATGKPLESGPVADVRTKAPVSADVRGAFRELVLFLQDENPFTKSGEAPGGSFNLRVEPPGAREGDPSRRFSSLAHGDPVTPILRAYLGDPFVVRGLVPGSSEVHSLHLDGHPFRLEPWSPTSRPASTAYIGISERFDLAVPAAGGPGRFPGDYLFLDGRPSKLRDGSWGLIRVLDKPDAGLRPLPGREKAPAPATAACPAAAPRRAFRVAALKLPLPMLGGEAGKLYALEADVAALREGARKPEPLVLRIGVGDCLVVTLRNATGGPATFHADMLVTDPQARGLQAGRSGAPAVPPGGTREYRFYAHPAVGETTALVRDWGDALANPRLGLYGAVVVGPAGARYTDPVTGGDLAGRSSWRADVHPAKGRSYRDFALFLQDEDEIIGTATMPYPQAVEGVAAINYGAEPLAARLEKNPDPALVYRADAHTMPATPTLEARQGDPVRLHVLSPWGEQQQVFSLEGHRWSQEPGRAGANLLSAAGMGGFGSLNLEPLGGAGGEVSLPGDYLYGDHREPYREAGRWGLFRVYPKEADAPVRPLTP
jgi:hypothetical protein